MEILSNCEWKRLKLLNIEDNHINDYSIDAIHSANWRSLIEINLNQSDNILKSNALTNLGILNLQKLGIKKAIVPNLKRIPKIAKKQKQYK